jgi:hypothetical protein
MVRGPSDLFKDEIMKRNEKKVDIKIEVNVAKILLAIAAILAVILN